MDMRVTDLLRAVQNGDDESWEPFVLCVLGELRRRARLLLLNEPLGHTLQPTALVNEAFLRLFDGTPIPWENSAQFLSSASREMRRVLIDHARRANAKKRSRGMAVELSEHVPAAMPDCTDAIALDRALDALANESQRAVSVIEMRFFTGLENAEIAAILGVTTKTVEREWAWARAWLLKYLSKKGSPENRI